MKLVILASLVFSLNSFAGNFGYNCVAANKKEEAKLDKAAVKLAPNYLKTIKVLVATADQCADATVGALQGQCVVNSYDLNIFAGKKAELVISSKIKIKLICEEDTTSDVQPSSGGSN